MNGDALSWIVGRGGLLGRHVVQAIDERPGGGTVWSTTIPVNWGDTRTALDDLRLEGGAFLDAARSADAPWRVFWCAGAGVVATPTAELERETTLLGLFLEWLGGAVEPSLARRGIVFFASSAGGVYAASSDSQPFSEESSVGALSPYGRRKLDQERLFSTFADVSGVELLVGRLSNLYGRGQNLAKPQGLVAHVGWAALHKEPVTIYVPLDTIRDYLFATDAGRMVVDAVERKEEARTSGLPSPRLKIFASEVETTVASVLAVWRQILRRPLRIATAAEPAGLLQPRLLSFRSSVWGDLRRQPTLFPIGVDAVRRDQFAQLMVSGDD